MTKSSVLLLIFIFLLAGCTNKPSSHMAPLSSTGPNSIVYTNKQYGFQFYLPDSWKGYSIVEGKWQGSVMDESSGSQPSEEMGPLISIRNPYWTAQTPTQDIPVMVFTTSQWSSLQRGDFYIGAAAVGPTELDHNDNYVFALPARYNYAFPPGYEEVEKILQSHSLVAVN